MQTLITIANNPIITIISGVMTVVAVLGILWGIILWLKGILPVLYRLGKSLARGKIAIFATEQFSDMQDMLVDSGLFKSSNITQIHSSSIKSAEKANLFVVHYSAFQEHMSEILDLKKDGVALVVYAPRQDGFIDDDVLNEINSHRNTTIVNFRGRLLNDILVSSITTRS